MVTNARIIKELARADLNVLGSEAGQRALSLALISSSTKLVLTCAKK
jgi:hypothetical protein